MDILIPIAVLFGIALVCAVLLTVANILFASKENEQFSAIRDALPGANCGACGYSGCDAYAKALAEGKTDKANLCVPGGDGVAAAIAEMIGVEAADVIEKVAYVACNGRCNTVDKKYEYVGVKSCRIANMAYQGDRVCNYACLGYGDCAAVCPNNAISIIDGVARVEPRACIGCGLCARTCPNGIIHLVNDTTTVVVECSNRDKGARTRKYCVNGCIGCGKCERTCEFGAIKVVNNLAVIDHEKCTSCGKCAEACPVHCIHEGSFICGSHF